MKDIAHFIDKFGFAFNKQKKSKGNITSSPTTMKLKPTITVNFLVLGSSNDSHICKTRLLFEYLQQDAFSPRSNPIKKLKKEKDYPDQIANINFFTEEYLIQENGNTTVIDTINGIILAIDVSALSYQAILAKCQELIDFKKMHHIPVFMIGMISETFPLVLLNGEAELDTCMELMSFNRQKSSIINIDHYDLLVTTMDEIITQTIAIGHNIFFDHEPISQYNMKRM